MVLLNFSNGAITLFYAISIFVYGEVEIAGETFEVIVGVTWKDAFLAVEGAGNADPIWVIEHLRSTGGQATFVLMRDLVYWVKESSIWAETSEDCWGQPWWATESWEGSAAADS